MHTAGEPAMTFRRKYFKTAGLIGAAALMMTSVSVAAEQAVYRFDLPAQPLMDSLRAIAQQTGSNVLFQSRDLSGINAIELKGELTAAEAIERLLVGTKLQTQRTTPTTVIVQPIA